MNAYATKAVASVRKGPNRTKRLLEAGKFYIVGSKFRADNAKVAIALFADTAHHAPKCYVFNVGLEDRQRHWLTDAHDQIERLKKTKPEWKVAYHWSEEILDQLNEADLQPDRIVPSAEGGVSFYFLREGGYAMVEALASGDIIAIVKDQEKEPEVWEIDHDRGAIRDAVSTISGFKLKLPHEASGTSPEPA